MTDVGIPGIWPCKEPSPVRTTGQGRYQAQLRRCAQSKHGGCTTGRREADNVRLGGNPALDLQLGQVDF